MHSRSRVVEVLAQDREFVAAESGHDVGRTQHRAQAVGQRTQQLIPGFVAEAVVHNLEAIEVDEEHGHGGAQTPRAPQSTFQQFLELRTVGQPGQRVVMGLMSEAVLELLAFDGDGGERRQQVNGLTLRRRGFAGFPVREQQSADDAVVGPRHQRHHAQRAQAMCARKLAVSGQSRIVLDVDDVERLTARCRLDKLSVFHDGHACQRLAELGRKARCGGHDQGLAVLVGDHHGAQRIGALTLDGATDFLQRFGQRGGGSDHLEDVGLVAHLLLAVAQGDLGLPLTRDIAGSDDQRTDDGIVEQVVGDGLEDAP